MYNKTIKYKQTECVKIFISLFYIILMTKRNKFTKKSWCIRVIRSGIRLHWLRFWFTRKNLSQSDSFKNRTTLVALYSSKSLERTNTESLHWKSDYTGWVVCVWFTKKNSFRVLRLGIGLHWLCSVFGSQKGTDSESFGNRTTLVTLYVFDSLKRTS